MAQRVIASDTPNPSGASGSGGAGSSGEAWHQLVELAAARLRGAGWRVDSLRHERDAAWHVAARRGDKWCIVQVLAPATSADARQVRRRELGEAVRLTPRRGTMEQWFAHVRPGGQVVFGTEALNGVLWIGHGDEGQVAERLGLPPAETG